MVTKQTIYYITSKTTTNKVIRLEKRHSSTMEEILELRHHGVQTPAQALHSSINTEHTSSVSVKCTPDKGCHKPNNVKRQT